MKTINPATEGKQKSAPLSLQGEPRGALVGVRVEIGDLPILKTSVCLYSVRINGVNTVF